MYKVFRLLFIVLIVSNFDPNLGAQVSSSKTDSSSLFKAFANGDFKGKLRYYFMATDNELGLRDYYANAAGGNLRYETVSFHGFKIAIGGSYVFNVLSSDLSADKSTSQPNRYEIGLFEMDGTSNRKVFARLEEAYVSYSWKNSTVKYGNQLINTPFINLQDGRMSPTAVEGLWLDLKPNSKFNLKGGYIHRVSPRGTNNWYYVNNSMGIYPVGVDEAGVKSKYTNQLSSRGLLIIEANWNFSKWLAFKFNDVMVDNIINTSMVQVDVAKRINDMNTLSFSLQGMRQDAINDGGNINEQLNYTDKGHKAFSYGARIQYNQMNWTHSLNFNRITNNGRYLMPREWGRDPFFTFLPRERNEGFGDVSALVAKSEFRKKYFKYTIGFGYIEMPDVLNYELNKYGMPSYTHLNLGVNYNFEKYLKGLNGELLITRKDRTGKTYDNNKYVINKVNMTLFNLVLNYTF